MKEGEEEMLCLFAGRTQCVPREKLFKNQLPIHNATKQEASWKS